jgi:hypothetical protein
MSAQRWSLDRARVPRGAFAVLLIAWSWTAGARAAECQCTVPPSEQIARLAVNRLGVQISNNGAFAAVLGCGDGGLEFPRGSGHTVAYTGGLWLSGRAAGSLREAVCEYGSEFVPGPAVPGGPPLDTLRHRVYSVSRWDTTGTGAWMTRAVPLGAPVDSAGTGPGLIGDQTLWSVCTDAGVTSTVRRGPRVPIGLEVQLTAYAFDRGTPLRDVAFLHFVIVHRGTVALDSAFVGLFYDADTRTAWTTPAASDTSFDMGYVYRTSNDYDTLYGYAGPATGAMLLRGPVASAGGSPLRATSIVGYPNGLDPANPSQFDAVLQGRYPWGASMLDSTTQQPGRFFAWGDPVTGTGWRMPSWIHPKLVIAAGPFHFAPGDTQVVDAAIVVGQGTDALQSVVALRGNAREAQDQYASGFATLPAPSPPPPPMPPTPFAIFATPNPSMGSVDLALGVPAPGGRVTIDVLDLAGRWVRTVADGWHAGGPMRVTWDGLDDHGRTARPGVYFARARVAGTTQGCRLVRMP